jgi:gas vesicle protein
MSNFGKDLLLLTGGVAVGALLGVLFAPAQGVVTRRKISNTTRDLKNSVVDKFEVLVESAEEIVEELKETANEIIHGDKAEVKVRPNTTNKQKP